MAGQAARSLQQVAQPNLSLRQFGVAQHHIADGAGKQISAHKIRKGHMSTAGGPVALRGETLRAEVVACGNVHDTVADPSSEAPIEQEENEAIRAQ